MSLHLEEKSVDRTPRAGITIGIALSFCVMAIVVVCALFGSAVAPDSPFTQRLELGDAPPSAEFLAGTDLLGRDVLSRVIYGSWTALVGPIVVAVGAWMIATILGLVSGYLGGWVDSATMRWVDFMLALPAPLIAIVVVGVVGGGYWTAVLVLIILFTAPDTRIVRSAVLEQRPRPYIDAARALGISKTRILFVHILPNVLPIILAYVVLDFAFAVSDLPDPDSPTMATVSPRPISRLMPAVMASPAWESDRLRTVSNGAACLSGIIASAARTANHRSNSC